MLILFSMMPEGNVSWRWDWTVASPGEERGLRNGTLDEIDLDRAVVFVLSL